MHWPRPTACGRRRRPPVPQAGAGDAARSRGSGAGRPGRRHRLPGRVGRRRRRQLAGRGCPLLRGPHPGLPAPRPGAERRRCAGIAGHGVWTWPPGRPARPRRRGRGALPGPRPAVRPPRPSIPARGGRPGGGRASWARVRRHAGCVGLAGPLLEAKAAAPGRAGALWTGAEPRAPARRDADPAAEGPRRAAVARRPLTTDGAQLGHAPAAGRRRRQPETGSRPRRPRPAPGRHQTSTPGRRPESVAPSAPA